MTSFQEQPIEVQEPRSGVATASLVCSLIICCPLTTIIGPILGIVALLGLRKSPHIKGKGVALAGIIVGMIATIIWVIAGFILVDIGFEFIEKTTQTTSNVIQFGTDGEYDLCRSNLTRENENLSDEEIEEFVTTLQTRYGKFDSVTINYESQPQQLTSTQTEAVIPVQIVFETSSIYAETMLKVNPNSSSQFDFEFKLVCLKIFDTEHGILIFPADSPCSE